MAGLRIGALIVLAGCASSTPPSSTTAVPVTTAMTNAGNQTVAVQTVAEGRMLGATVQVPADRAWAVLPAVYAALGIPLSRIDSTQRMLGAEGAPAHAKLGGVSLRRYLDCGGSGGVLNAETFDISLTIFTRVRPTGSGASAVETGISASGHDPMFGGGSVVNCGSSGVLERRIADMVQEQAK